MENHTQNVVCPLCGGDGKETCTNPDHGFIGMMSFHDIGRIGCPCCGHDEQHKVPNGGNCELCEGAGNINEAAALEWAEDNNYNNEFERI